MPSSTVIHLQRRTDTSDRCAEPAYIYHAACHQPQPRVLSTRRKEVTCRRCIKKMEHP